MEQPIIQDHQCYSPSHNWWNLVKVDLHQNLQLILRVCFLANAAESTGTYLTTAENLQKNSEMDFVDKWIDPILSVNLQVSQIQPHPKR